jgi:hypothetical protein
VKPPPPPAPPRKRGTVVNVILDCFEHGRYDPKGDANRHCPECEMDRLGITGRDIAETMPPEGER